MTKKELFKEMCLFPVNKSCDICAIKKDALLIIGFEDSRFKRYRYICKDCFVGGKDD